MAEATIPQPSAADLIKESAFKTFREGYSPERTTKAQQELHRTTREVCNILTDVCEIPPTEMAEMLTVNGFKMCIDHDGRVKWKIFKNIDFEREDD